MRINTEDVTWEFVSRDWTRYYGEIWGDIEWHISPSIGFSLWFNGIIMGIYFMNLHYLCQHMSTSWYEKNGPLPENGEKRYISHGLASFHQIDIAIPNSCWCTRQTIDFIKFATIDSPHITSYYIYICIMLVRTHSWVKSLIFGR